MARKKAGCDRCQALLAKSGRRCRNLAQCRVRSATKSLQLCNVHEEYVRQHGIDSLRYDIVVPVDQRQADQMPVFPLQLPPPPKITRPTVDVSDDLRQLASVQADQQRQIGELLRHLDAKPEPSDAAEATLNSHLQELAAEQRNQRNAIRDLTNAMRKSVFSDAPPVSTIATAVAPPVSVAAIARALKRISETQQKHTAQLESVAMRVDAMQRKQVRAPEEPEEPTAAVASDERAPTKEESVPASVRQARPLSRQMTAIVDQLDQTARVAHGELGTLRSLGATFCRRLTREQIEKELQPLTALLNRIDALIAAVRDDIVRSNADASSGSAKTNANVAPVLAPKLTERGKEQRALRKELEQQSKKVRKRLEKRCRQKRFTFAPALRFAQDVVAGKVQCNKRAVPLALRNWFASGATADDELVAYNWTDRRLLCNLSDIEDADDAESDSDDDDNSDDERASSSLTAFERDQALRGDFKVYDVQGNVVAIGRRDTDDESKADSGIGGVGIGARAAKQGDAVNIDALLQQYLRLLDTLDLLIDLYAVAGRDTRGLATERQALRQSIVNLALKAGRDRALQFMSAERYELLLLQASLLSAYAPYLETEEGIAELASLAAFAASERSRANGVSDSLRRQVARQTYAQTLRALTLIGGAGSLAQTLWLLFAAAPRTVTPIVPAMPRAAPPVGQQSRTFGAPALPVPAVDAGRELSSDAALPFVFREQTRANVQARVQNDVAQLTQQTARDAAAIATLSPLDGARIKLAGLFNETRSFGARQFPLTRNQWRREQLSSTLELLSPSSRHIERLYERVRLGGVRIRPQLQERFEQQARQRAAVRLRGAAQLGVPDAERNAERRDEQASLLSGSARGESEPSLPLFLPPGGLYEGVGPSGPLSMLPGAAAPGAAISAPSALGQLASNANLLSAIAQAMGPAPPLAVDFDPAVQRLLQERGYNVSNVDELLAANAAMFADRTTLLRNYDRGLGALQKYRAQRYGPSAAARQRDPQSAAALASASNAALRAIEERPDDFFDDWRAPALGDAANSVAQNAELFAIEETPLHFLRQTAGVLSPSGTLTQNDALRMSERVDSVAGGFANSTALDLHLARTFERHRASGASALEIGIDAGMLAVAADDTGAALNEFRLRAGSMSAQRRREAERAVDAAALLAEREFGGGARVQSAASVALKAREVRNLFASDVAALHGFVSGLVEKAYEAEVATLERANEYAHILAKLVSDVGGVTIEQASIVTERVGDALAQVGERALQSAQSREEIDRIMFTTLSRDLRGAMTDDRIRYVIDATLDGLATVGRVSSAAGAQIGAALQTYSKDAAVLASDVIDLLSNALSNNGRAWSQYGQEQARAALRVLGRAGQRALDETNRVLEQVQRDAPEVWRNEVRPRLERAERTYKAQINYLARNYMPPVGASDAERVQAALDVRERGTQAFRELQESNRTLLRDVGNRLARRRRATIGEQRTALLAVIRMRGQQRADLERRMRAARRAELARLANATLVAPPETNIDIAVPRQADEPASAKASQQIQFGNVLSSVHYQQWLDDMNDANLERANVRRNERAQNLVKTHDESVRKLAQNEEDEVNNVDAISNADVPYEYEKYEGALTTYGVFYRANRALTNCLVGETLVWFLRLSQGPFDDTAIEECGRANKIDPKLIELYKKNYGSGSKNSQQQQAMQPSMFPVEQQFASETQQEPPSVIEASTDSVPSLQFAQTTSRTPADEQIEFVQSATARPSSGIRI